MKLLTRTLTLLTIASLTLFFANCGGDDNGGTPKQKKQLQKLSKTWNLVSAELEGVTGQPVQIGDNFTLTIGGTFDSDTPDGPYTYSVTDTEFPSPWEPSGTWEFVSIGSGNSGMIVRSDGVGVSYTLASNGQLNLSFNFPESAEGHPGAKTKAVGGDWTFVLE